MELLIIKGKPMNYFFVIVADRANFRTAATSAWRVVGMINHSGRFGVALG
jgi:hypothetical protein